MPFNFMTYYYLKYFHQYVSTRNASIFRVMFFDTIIQLQLMCDHHFTILKIWSFPFQ